MVCARVLVLGERGVLVLGERGVLVLGERGVLVLGERGVPVLGERGVPVLGGRGVGVVLGLPCSWALRKKLDARATTHIAKNLLITFYSFNFENKRAFSLIPIALFGRQ
jgi:hypothetical protein